MAKHGKRWPPAIMVGCALAMTLTAIAPGAAAFDLRQTSQGQPLRWNAPQVSYVVDPSLEDAVAGGSAAVTTAAQGWNASGGAPKMVLTAGAGGAQPGIDGKNSILFAPEGFAPAGQALAVTITSFDQDSGEIVDTDIVVNGMYRFRVLPSGATATSGASPVATDGSGHSGEGAASAPFDLVHVLSHELGHSLGLADETASHAALMYAYTMPGDASVRIPSSDDLAGVDAIYGPTGAASAAEVAAHAGCGQASVAGGPTHGAAGSLGSVLVVALVAGWLIVRRRGGSMSGRGALPLSAALVAVLSGPASSGSARTAVVGDARARVVRAVTMNTGGLFETTVELVPTACRASSACPSRARAHVWGGSLGGITQRVGEQVPPSTGDEVDLQFFADGSGDAAVDAEGVARAALLTTRR